MGKGNNSKVLNSLEGTVKSTMKSVKSTIKDVEIPKIDVEEIKNIDVKAEFNKAIDIGKQIPNKVQEGVGSVKTTVVKAAEKMSTKNESEGFADASQQSGGAPQYLDSISITSALKILYYLISADGEINSEEKDKYRELCMQLDPEFEEKEEELINACQVQLGSDPLDSGVLEIAVEKAIKESYIASDAHISSKLLLWNLLTIAYSDDECSEPEKKLINYLRIRFELDEATLLEMESSILTFIDIEKEQNWIKRTEKPYLTIEAMVNELEERKVAIMESIKELVLL